MEGQSGKCLKGACKTTLLASLAYHIVLVLLGAPLTNCSTPFMTDADCPSDNLHLRTYLLALLLALLTIPAPAYSIGAPKFSDTTHDSQTLVHRLLWTRLFAECTIRNSFERALVYPSVGALLGSWIGAIPIALDWDRPWQAWPLTPAYGAIAGYIIASLAALTVAAINFSAVEHLRAQAISELKPKPKAKST
jgi:phosphatidylinositol glycan class F